MPRPGSSISPWQGRAAEGISPSNSTESRPAKRARDEGGQGKCPGGASISILCPFYTRDECPLHCPVKHNPSPG